MQPPKKENMKDKQIHNCDLLQIIKYSDNDICPTIFHKYFKGLLH